MKIALVFLCVFLSCTCLAQDANYWSSAYGPGAFFTPGSVVSYNGDSGVVFYNPALLAYSRRNAASISATVYQYNMTHIKDGAGTGFDIKSSGFSVIPLIASHTVPLKWKLPITVIYAITNRPVMLYQTSKRQEEVLDALDNYYSPGSELFIGQFTHNEIASETAGLVSAGIKLKPNFSVGMSLEGRVYRRHTLFRTQSRVLENITDSTVFPPVVNVEQFYEAMATNGGLRIKLGANYEFDNNHHFGMVVSLPLIKIFGKGSLTSDIQINDLTLSPGVTVNLLASTQQEHLKSTWKMPLSIAAGYTWKHRKGMLYFSAEYFGKIKLYDVLAPKDQSFIRPDTVSSTYAYDVLRYMDARKALLNAGIGFSYELREAIVGYLSFRTDFNYLDLKSLEDKRGFVAATSRWNSYHMQLGSNFRFKRSNIRAGALLTYGLSHSFEQVMNFDNPDESNLLLGETVDTKATHFQAGFMVSYLYNL
ncbi:hypothetical protein [Pollutibacter soli]|uniref:hypothetical protein n=1 Tax=Pollutibacter soli TaxID=3034157 RepID=UPI0030139374